MPAPLLAAAALAASSLAGITPENVLVVVNGDSWASLTVANEYARLRHIPPGNFVVLSGVSAPDFTDAGRFRKEILEPVFKAIDDRGLRGQIDCITYSLDLPCAVAVSADMAGKDFGQTTTPVASANGLTYLHEWFLRKDPDYLRLDVNRYARRTLPLATGAPLTAAEQAEYQRGMKLYDEKKYPEAATVLAALMKVKRADPGMLYNLACCLALAGRGDEAVAALADAVDAGWRNYGQTGADPDLAAVRDRADFRALVTRMVDAKIIIQPTRGFSSRHAWTQAGDPSAEDAAGPHYMLSTMLGVASGRGNSVAEVLDCLKRAAAADGSAPKGPFCFVRNGDVRSTTREWAFRAAADQLAALGLPVALEDGVLPAAKRDLAGAVLGAAEFNWTDSKSTIAPGAIVEHLTSCGGMMGERDSQTPCTDLIRAGAAGTSGAVTEPYALQEKFPDAFLHVHYALGSSLAEAFYQSVRGPYQLLIIGDPLTKPWPAKGAAKASLAGVAAPLAGALHLKPAADPNALGGLAGFELLVDGLPAAKAAPGATLALDTTAFPDGEHTLTVLARHKDLLESQSRGEYTVRFANTDRALRVLKKPLSPVPFGQTASLELDCPGASGFDVLHLGRVVAHADGEHASLDIDTARLGAGRILLRPLALSPDVSKRVAGPAVEFEVALPAPLPSKGAAPPANGPKGLALTIADAPPVAAEALDPAWIAAVPAGKPFEAIGAFEVAPASAVPKPELFQIQLQTNTAAVIEIDGVKLLTARNQAWAYAPARLAPGRHSFRITGVAPADQPPRLDLRLGLQGAQHPTARRFAWPAPKK